MLRSRRTRREDPIIDKVATGGDAERDAVLAYEVGRALLVVDGQAGAGGASGVRPP
jgi:hypothetical protein